MSLSISSTSGVCDIQPESVTNAKNTLDDFINLANRRATQWQASVTPTLRTISELQKSPLDIDIQKKRTTSVMAYFTIFG